MINSNNKYSSNSHLHFQKTQVLNSKNYIIHTYRFTKKGFLLLIDSNNRRNQFHSRKFKNKYAKIIMRLLDKVKMNNNKE